MSVLTLLKETITQLFNSSLSGYFEKPFEQEFANIVSQMPTGDRD